MGSGMGWVRGRPRGLWGGLLLLSDIVIWLLLDMLHFTSFCPISQWRGNDSYSVQVVLFREAGFSARCMNPIFLFLVAAIPVDKS
jgi:hypothetical protein